MTAQAIRFGSANYRIVIHDPGRINGRDTAFVEDGRLLPGTALRMSDSGEHDVQVFANADAWDAWRAANEPLASGQLHERSV